MSVGSAGAVAPAPTAPPPAVVMVDWPATGRELAGNVADGLDQLLRHPTDGGKHFAQGQAGQHPTSLLDAVFAFARGPFFQSVVNLMADSACLLDRFPHGEDQTGDGNLRPLREV